MIDEIIRECSVLQDNRDKYATDQMSLIVSWVDLRPLFGDQFRDARPMSEVFSKEMILRAASK